MSDDLTRLVEQARSMGAAVKWKGLADLLAGLADAVVELQDELRAVYAARQRTIAKRAKDVARVAALEAGIRAYVAASEALQQDNPPEDAWLEASGRFEGLVSLLDET